ncbi:MAG: endo-1,4-beta-xylanase [Paludibacteraceae bacterium]|nr:endo-1,4-beta-xylanase [Paludibacteraceae bacterium]
MNTIKQIVLTTLSAATLCVTLLSCKPKAEIGLKDAFANKFYVGVAMNTAQITGNDSLALALIKKHFNSIVAENCMKSEVVQPVEGEFDFTLADRMIKLGEENKMHVVGHTLIWHSQAPKWFFTDAEGNEVTREVLAARMKNHIQTVVSRYKGRVHGWDVVNEAINDDGSWRESPFYKILGKDFVKLAFQYAQEADPDAELYYNDYSMSLEGRRNGVIAMVKDLQSQGIKVSGIGMQGHLDMDFPDIKEFENSIEAFAALGVKVMITELDMTVLPSPWSQTGANIADKAEYQEKMNPYVNGVTPEVNAEWENRFLSFFELFAKHSDKISRVTLWGLRDADSWKNNWPIRGRTDYPLLFDRNYEAKPVVKRIMGINPKP